jgi:hypothetical protein
MGGQYSAAICRIKERISFLPESQFSSISQMRQLASGDPQQTTRLDTCKPVVFILFAAHILPP